MAPTWMAGAPCVVLGLVAIFMLPVADAVYLAIGPCLIKGLNCFLDMAKDEKATLGTHFKALQGKPGAHVVNHP